MRATALEARLEGGAIGLVCANAPRTWDAISKRKCELSFLDFVELLWPVLEPGQPFVRGWIQEAIAAHLEAVTAGTIDKLLMNVPPGSSKSMLANTFWPAWEWGPKKRPDLRYISWSYSAALTERDNTSCRKLVESELYQRLWGQCAACRVRKASAPRCATCEADKRFRLDGDSNAKKMYRNDWGGFRYATSIGGGGTGHRADRLIFDDPHNVKDAESDAERDATVGWFATTLPSRVRNMEKGKRDVQLPEWIRVAHRRPRYEQRDGAVASATIGIMQRVHLRDVSGVILETPALGYQHLLIEMTYAGERHPARVANDNKPAPSPGSKIGFVDPRAARLVSIPKQPEGDDPISCLIRGFVKVALEVNRLADPVRYPWHKLLELKAQLLVGHGPNAWEAQYEQWPQEPGGKFFPRLLLKRVRADELSPPKSGYETRGWDLAATDSDSAAATVGVRGYIDVEDRVIFRHVAKVRGGPDVVDDLIEGTAELDGAEVVQDLPRDPGQAGKYQANAFTKLLIGHAVETSPEAGAKHARAWPLASQWLAGNCYAVDDGTWDIEEFARIMSEFPVGQFKDEVDASSRMFDSQVRAAPVQIPVAPRIVKRSS